MMTEAKHALLRESQTFRSRRNLEHHLVQPPHLISARFFSPLFFLGMSNQNQYFLRQIESKATSLVQHWTESRAQLQWTPVTSHQIPRVPYWFCVPFLSLDAFNPDLNNCESLQRAVFLPLGQPCILGSMGVGGLVSG